MTEIIKALVKSNQEKRATFIRDKNSEAFQTALIKIQNRLKTYNPSKESLSVDIQPFPDRNKNEELCTQLVKHLTEQGILCSYKYDPGYTLEDDFQLASYNIVFVF